MIALYVLLFSKWREKMNNLLIHGKSLLLTTLTKGKHLTYYKIVLENTYLQKRFIWRVGFYGKTSTPELILKWQCQG
jgi:hypothetical protein